MSHEQESNSLSIVEVRRRLALFRPRQANPLPRPDPALEAFHDGLDIYIPGSDVTDENAIIRIL